MDFLWVKCISSSPNIILLYSIICLDKCPMYLATQVRILSIMLDSSFFLHNFLPVDLQFLLSWLPKISWVYSFLSFPTLVTNSGPPSPLPKYMIILNSFPALSSNSPPVNSTHSCRRDLFQHSNLLMSLAGAIFFLNGSLVEIKQNPLEWLVNGLLSSELLSHDLSAP